MSEDLIPDDLSLMECLAVYHVLKRVKARALSGIPSGKVLDQALEEVLALGIGPSKRDRSTAQSPRW